MKRVSKSPKNEVFAQRLREVRERHHKTQDELGTMMGFHSRGVGYGGWERSETEPGLQDLVKLCEIFGVTADWLLGRSDAANTGCALKEELAEDVQKMRQEIKAASANLFILNQRLEKIEVKMK